TPLSFGHCLFEAGFSDITCRGRYNAWPPRLTVPLYGRLGYKCFRVVTECYGRISGKGTEIIGVGRK
ncbi:hypothetical protein N9M41_06015, partial [Rhodopirellula sp.]|nr:hypothetical protein [Rhodopirellula sp.]